MKTIEETFNLLTSGEVNPEAIRNLIGQTEDLYLECKTIAKDEIEGNLITNKQSVVYLNLGKCISAFANAEGGIVVWGLFAKEQKNKLPDIIHEERPVENLLKVKTDFDSILGKVVSRRVVGVQNKIVYTDKDKDEGFIITYIPKSDEAPHMVEGERNGSQKYYRRHGSGSFPLEDMFGGRASPKLICVYKIEVNNKKKEKIKNYRLIFGLKNIGRSIAKFPFLEIVDPGHSSKYPYGLTGSIGSTGIPSVLGNLSKYQGDAGRIIHIDDVLWVDKYIVTIPEGLHPLVTTSIMRVKIACEGFKMRTLTLQFDVQNAREPHSTFEFEILPQ